MVVCRIYWDTIVCNIHVIINTKNISVSLYIRIDHILQLYVYHSFIILPPFVLSLMQEL